MRWIYEKMESRCKYVKGAGRGENFPDMNNGEWMKNLDRKLKIKEIELKSMNNIEKATQEFNLVSPEDISYVEIDGPVAMK